MTEDNIRFVKEVKIRMADCMNEDCESCPDRDRLLTLLIESEAMRDQAEFLGSHSDIALHDGCACCEKHKWSNSDWIAAKKKEIGI